MPLPKGMAAERVTQPTISMSSSGDCDDPSLMRQRPLLVRPDQFQLPSELESRIQQHPSLWTQFLTERTRLANLLNTLLISQFAGRYHEIYWPNRPETRYAVKLFEENVWVDFLQLFQRRCQEMESRTIVKVKKGKKKQSTSNLTPQRVTAAAATSSSATSSTTSTPTLRPSAAVKMEDADSAPKYPVRSSPKTKQRFTIEGGEICEQWFIDHIHDPYPSDADKEELACRANVHYDQISSWFINARMRKWQKLLARVQKGEVKQTAQMNEEEKQNQREIAERIKNKEATVRPLTRVSLKGKTKNRTAVDLLNAATAAAASAMANIRRSTRQPKPVQYDVSEMDLGGVEEDEDDVDDDATEVDHEHDDEEGDENELDTFEDDSMSNAFSGTTEGSNEIASAAAVSIAVPELYSTQLLPFHLSSIVSMARMSGMNDLQSTTTLLSVPHVSGGLTDSLVSSFPSGHSSVPASNKSTPTQTLTSSQQQPLQTNHMFLMPHGAATMEDQPQAGVLSTVDMMRLSTTGTQPMMMSSGLTNQWQMNTPQTTLNGTVLGRDGMIMQPMNLSANSPFMMPLINSVDMNGVRVMGSSGYVPSNSNDLDFTGLPAFNVPMGFASFQSSNSSTSIPPPMAEEYQSNSANNGHDGTTISNGGVIRITPAKMVNRAKTEPK